MPMLIILFENFELILDGEINTKSLCFSAISNSSFVIGPITTLTLLDLISLIALLSFSFSLKPESLGTIITFSSFISSRASCKE